MGVANAVGACVSPSELVPVLFRLPESLLGLAQRCAWEEETFKWQCGHITRSRWLRVGVITQHRKSRLETETRPPLHSGLCCKGSSEVRGLAFIFVCWEQCNAWGWRQPCCDLSGRIAHLRPHSVLHVVWNGSATTGWPTPGQGVGRTLSEPTTRTRNY